jgi:hypothetical protein
VQNVMGNENKRFQYDSRIASSARDSLVWLNVIGQRMDGQLVNFLTLTGSLTAAPAGTGSG